MARSVLFSDRAVAFLIICLHNIQRILYFCDDVNNLIVSQPLHIFYVGIVAALNMVGQIYS